MGWAPMTPELDTCGMTNWVGSFDPVKFIYFMLATVLIPYPLIAELDFAKTSLESFSSWPFGMYALFAGAVAVILAFAGYHIYLGIILNRTVPGFIGYYLLGLLIPVLLVLIGYACLMQQNSDIFRLSKVYNFMLHLQWRWSTRTTRRNAAKQKKLDDSQSNVRTIDPPVQPGEGSDSQEGTVVVSISDQQSSNHVSRSGSYDNLITITSNTNNNNVSYAVAPAGTFSASLENIDNNNNAIVIPPYQTYVWSASVRARFHPHHWQIFYTLAFFTRFDSWVSRVGAGITIGAYMQGIMDLQPHTIYTRFEKEFPDSAEQPQTLRWRDNDGDWILIRKDDTELDGILSAIVKKNGDIHIQSGDASAVHEPAELVTLMKRYERVMDTFDLLTRSIVKLPPISNILIVTKPDPKLSRLTKELTVWLIENFQGISVYVDKKLQDQPSFRYYETLKKHPSWKDRVHFWTKDRCDDNSHDIHLAVALGGDGTVLYTAWMFQQRSPPIVAFHLGSLGFLTNFHFDNYKATMTNIIRGNGINVNLRMRLHCTVYKYKYNHVSPLLKQDANARIRTSKRMNGKTNASSESDSEGNSSEDDDESVNAEESSRRAEIMQRVKVMDSKRAAEVADLGVSHEDARALVKKIQRPNIGVTMTLSDSWQVLNEVTVDRGSNAGMLLLELYVDGEPVTTILADGLVIATATGSTAYSLSIGGSLIHPDKNAIIISPIAPHSLTARPMILPGTRHLRIRVPDTSRSTAWASFDGRHRQELGRGDSVMITGSKYPAVTVCRRDQSTDWFHGLTQVLNWNSRAQQKPFGSHL
ncbi:hypothetical protein BGZ76_011008 [Entomortierella beljakovae]|nr:hypothetical protein BGZ76_011008 [Entomortierella beljakovae]